jgi:hypothetical protein
MKVQLPTTQVESDKMAELMVEAKRQIDDQCLATARRYRRKHGRWPEWVSWRWKEGWEKQPASVPMIEVVFCAVQFTEPALRTNQYQYGLLNATIDKCDTEYCRCPDCGAVLECDEVDIGVGIQRGNWHCMCCMWNPETDGFPVGDPFAKATERTIEPQRLSYAAADEVFASHLRARRRREQRKADPTGG